MATEEGDRADEAVPRTSLAPVVVFAGSCLLTLTSLIGAALAIAIFASQHISSSVGVSQTLALIAALLSFLYLGLYLLAARRDGRYNTTGRPEQSIQAACFVILRIAVLIWIAAAAANLITALGMPSCTGNGALCRLQQANTAISWTASFAAFALMCVVERSSQPFHTPAALNIRPKIVCRVSDFDDDNILQRSVSFSNTVHTRRSSHAERHEMHEMTKPEDSGPHHKIHRKSLVGSPNLNSAELTFKLLPTIVPLSPESNVESSWARDVHRALASSVSSVYSKTSGEEDGSSNDTVSETESQSNAGESTWTSTYSSRKDGKATPTPSSSIGSSSHRSPLSSVRMAENPDILIRPNLHLLPTPVTSPRRPPNTPRFQVGVYPYFTGPADPNIPYIHPAHRRRPSKQHGKGKAHLRQISCERRAAMSRTGYFQVSRPSTPQSIVESAGGTPKKRKKIEVRGAWVSYERLTDEHARKIEMEINRRAREIAAESDERDWTGSEASSVLDPLQTYSPMVPPKGTFDEDETTETSIDPDSSDSAKQELEDVMPRPSHKREASDEILDPETQSQIIARPTTISVSRAREILIPSRSDGSLSSHSTPQSASSTFSTPSPATSPATIITPPSPPLRDRTPPPSPSPIPSALRPKRPNRASPVLPAAAFVSPFPARASAVPLPLTIRKVTSPGLPADVRDAHPGDEQELGHPGDEQRLWHAPHSRRARGRNGEVRTPPDWPLPDPKSQFVPFVKLPREVERGREALRTPVKNPTERIRSMKSMEGPVQWRFLPPPERGDSATGLRTGLEGGQEKAVEVQGQGLAGLGLDIRQSRSVVQERSPRIASLRISTGFGWDDRMVV